MVTVKLPNIKSGAKTFENFIFKSIAMATYFGCLKV